MFRLLWSLVFIRFTEAEHCWSFSLLRYCKNLCNSITVQPCHCLFSSVQFNKWCVRLRILSGWNAFLCLSSFFVHIDLLQLQHNFFASLSDTSFMSSFDCFLFIKCVSCDKSTSNCSATKKLTALTCPWLTTCVISNYTIDWDDKHNLLRVLCLLWLTMSITQHLRNILSHSFMCIYNITHYTIKRKKHQSEVSLLRHHKRINRNLKAKSLMERKITSIHASYVARSIFTEFKYSILKWSLTHWIGSSHFWLRVCPKTATDYLVEQQTLADQANEYVPVCVIP